MTPTAIPALLVINERVNIVQLSLDVWSVLFCFLSIIRQRYCRRMSNAGCCQRSRLLVWLIRYGNGGDCRYVMFGPSATILHSIDRLYIRTCEIEISVLVMAYSLIICVTRCASWECCLTSLLFITVSTDSAVQLGRDWCSCRKVSTMPWVRIVDEVMSAPGARDHKRSVAVSASRHHLSRLCREVMSHRQRSETHPQPPALNVAIVLSVQHILSVLPRMWTDCSRRR